MSENEEKKNKVNTYRGLNDVEYIHIELSEGGSGELAGIGFYLYEDTSTGPEVEGPIFAGDVDKDTRLGILLNNIEHVLRTLWPAVIHESEQIDEHVGQAEAECQRTHTN